MISDADAGLSYWMMQRRRETAARLSAIADSSAAYISGIRPVLESAHALGIRNVDESMIGTVDNAIVHEYGTNVSGVMNMFAQSLSDLSHGFIQPYAETVKASFDLAQQLLQLAVISTAHGHPHTLFKEVITNEGDRNMLERLVGITASFIATPMQNAQKLREAPASGMSTDLDHLNRFARAIEPAKQLISDLYTTPAGTLIATPRASLGKIIQQGRESFAAAVGHIFVESLPYNI